MLFQYIDFLIIKSTLDAISMSKPREEEHLEAEEKIETLQFIHDKNYKLIELADNKAATILTINGIILTVVFALVSLSSDFFNLGDALDIIRLVCFALYFIFSGGSIIYSIKTISPLTMTGIKLEKDIFYYKNILQYENQEEYAKDVKDQLDDFPRIIRSFSHQIYSVSTVNERKYKNIRRCVWLLFGALVMLISLITVMFL